MSTHNRNILNNLLKVWPLGAVATQTWLIQNGVNRSLARKYVKSGWIKHFGPGAFVRSDMGLNDQPLWTGGLYAVQKQLRLPIFAGGESALRWNGYNHTALISTTPPLFLFAPKGSKLPAWFRKHKWDQEILFQTTDFLPYTNELGLTEDNQSGYPIILSSPERAILEAILLMPSYTTFENVTNLMEGLSTFRPDLVTTLLKSCKSVKVKRTFLYLAEHANHNWFSQLDLTDVNLGKGKRTVVPGGKFDAKYQITVEPKSPMSTA